MDAGGLLQAQQRHIMAVLDLGVGLRRNVDSSGLLSYLQVDFAWPMGADTGPARITLTLSARRFD